MEIPRVGFAVSSPWLCFAGYTKDSMKLVNMFRSKDRYEPSPETQAIVNAKYQ